MTMMRMGTGQGHNTGYQHGKGCQVVSKLEESLAGIMHENACSGQSNIRDSIIIS